MDKTILNINNIEFTIYSNYSVFGDGSHESTASILNVMSKIDLAGKKVLDIGTGTGILSAFAALSGAEVMAVDISPAAMEFARKNFETNDVEVDLRLNDLTQDINERFDVIVANLAPAPQVENMKTVKQYLTENGILVISWINHLDLKHHAPQFDVIRHIVNKEYDVYELKLTK